MSLQNEMRQLITITIVLAVGLLLFVNFAFYPLEDFIPILPDFFKDRSLFQILQDPITITIIGMFSVSAFVIILVRTYK